MAGEDDAVGGGEGGWLVGDVDAKIDAFANGCAGKRLRDRGEVAAAAINDGDAH